MAETSNFSGRIGLYEIAYYLKKNAYFANFLAVNTEWSMSLHTIFKIFIIVSFTIALVGQSFAYAMMSCDMSGHGASHSEMVDTKMSHDSHDSEHSQMLSAEDPCCASDCVCPTNGCSSAVFVSTSSTNTAPYFSDESPVLAGNILLQLISSSLYRPPILA